MLVRMSINYRNCMELRVFVFIVVFVSQCLVAFKWSGICCFQESHGCSTISTPACHAWGSCGFQIAGLEVKVFKVDHADINKKTQCPAAPSLDTTDELFQGHPFCHLCCHPESSLVAYHSSMPADPMQIWSNMASSLWNVAVSFLSADCRWHRWTCAPQVVLWVSELQPSGRWDLLQGPNHHDTRWEIKVGGTQEASIRCINPWPEGRIAVFIFARATCFNRDKVYSIHLKILKSCQVMWFYEWFHAKSHQNRSWSEDGIHGPARLWPSSHQGDRKEDGGSHRCRGLDAYGRQRRGAIVGWSTWQLKD